MIFAYGTLGGSDAGTNISGQSVYPMYKVDIITQKQEIAKTYEVQDFTFWMAMWQTI